MDYKGQIKWHHLLAMTLISAFLIFFAAFRPENPHLKQIGYIPHFLKHNEYLYRHFRQKISNPAPLWMLRQIEKDLSLEKISLQALEETQKVIREKQIVSTNRYRIVDSKLYRYFDPATAKIQENW